MVHVLVAHPQGGFIDREDPGQLDGCGKNNEVAIRLIDCHLQIANLVRAIAHCREDGADVGVCPEDLPDCPPRIRPGINNHGGTIPGCGNKTCSVRHSSMGQGGAVLYYQYPLPLNQLGPHHQYG